MENSIKTNHVYIYLNHFTVQQKLTFNYTSIKTFKVPPDIAKCALNGKMLQPRMSE